MKDTLVFNLPEEREECEMAHKAGEAFCAIEDILNHMRTMRKWPPKRMKAGEMDAYDAMWDRFWEIVREHGLRIWE